MADEKQDHLILEKNALNQMIQELLSANIALRVATQILQNSLKSKDEQIDSMMKEIHRFSVPE